MRPQATEEALHRAWTGNRRWAAESARMSRSDAMFYSRMQRIHIGGRQNGQPGWTYRPVRESDIATATGPSQVLKRFGM
jgi:hypothetical protein